MKYLKLYLSIFILLFSLTSSFSQLGCIDPDDCLPTPGEGTPTTGGPGTMKVPIDDYAPILVILGITVAGIVIYRNKQRQVN